MRFSIILISIISFFSSAYSQQKTDTLFLKSSFRLDIIPLYDVFFDSHLQLRAGIEYERLLSKKLSACIYVDGGLYDKYDFIKYYDFFNQNQGMYSLKQTVTTAGFHLLPACNYYFYFFRRKPNRNFFSGTVMDFSWYHKTTDSYNSLTAATSSDSYNQIRLGMGLNLGFQNRFRKHFLYELKTTMAVKIFNSISKEGVNPIRAMDAQWTSPNYNFWWVSNIKIGYVF